MWRKPPTRQTDAPGLADPRALEVEYVKAMIEWTRDDIHQVHLRVTAALAVLVLFVTQIPFGRLVALEDDRLLFAGLGLLLAAAVLHRVYLARVHRSRRELAACLRDANGDRAALVWTQVWRRWGWAYVAGDVLLVAAVVVLGLVFNELLDVTLRAGG